jgi:hypothetical protein
MHALSKGPGMMMTVRQLSHRRAGPAPVLAAALAAIAGNDTKRRAPCVERGPRGHFASIW